MTWSADPAKNRAYRHGETGKIRWEVIQYCQGAGLDVGCGDHKVFPYAVGVDQRGKGANLASDVRDLRKLSTGEFDFVFSSHCLEDLEDTDGALREWWRVIRPGGHLVLYLPHADLYPRMGEPGANGAHKHDFLPGDIVKAMTRVAPAWTLRENQVRGDGDEYSFLQVFRKEEPAAGHALKVEESDPAKRCIVMRYGGYGDVLVAASTFPHLKAEGWHVTVYTGDKGAEILRHDPNVDRVVVNDVSLLRQADLDELTSYLRGRCTRFVNFSETFEGLCLASRKRAGWYWPHAMRERAYAGNYLECAHAAADVPQHYHQRFHATPMEQSWVSNWRANMPQLVVFALSGTGVNKRWPYAPELVRGILAAHPEAHIALVGDPGGFQFDESPRLHKLFETWSIRSTLALAQVASLVIGPETGVMNAVARDPMPKIVLLSHSSPDNLTLHWVNAWPLAGTVPCYPCHRIHADWSGCRKDEATGAAACQADIAAEHVLRWVNNLFRQREAA